MAFLKLGRLYLLLLMFMILATRHVNGLKRKKREWILPPTKLKENVDYTKLPFIAKIRSDKDTESKPFEYSLRGYGADKEPYNLFVVNPKSGFVRLTGLLDREHIQLFNLTGIAKYKDGNLVEDKIELKILVEDANDNSPKFKFLKGSVKECSKVGTPIMQITADDADEKGTPNTKIAYTILKQIPEESSSLFGIDRDTGGIYVKEPTLDREKQDSYTLIVQGVDLDGAINGNTATGTVEISVLDINDNVPTLEKEQYTGTIEEGAVDVVVMRIKAMDKDLKDTDNWLAVFNISKGNENGIFTIETDPKTNEGILTLVKPVDYETVKMLALDMDISNVAPFINGTALSLGVNLDTDQHKSSGMGAGVEAGAGTGAGVNAEVGADVEVGLDLGVGVDVNGGAGVKPQGTFDGSASAKPGSKPGSVSSGGKSYPIKIAVINLPEGPGFSPPLKELSVSEDPEEVKVPMVIGSFPALDLDTGEIAQNVRYAKGNDPENWLAIDEETSEIKLTKIPDRESVVNGTYIAKILCMTKDVPVKTATGTIALKVQDSNDNCPTLVSTYQSVCSDNIVVNMTAFDMDDNPNAKPFTFVLVEAETQGKWEMVPVNDIMVSFHAKEPVFIGFYELSVEISDKQGLACEDKQKLQLEVCTCEKSGTCISKLARQRHASVKVGAPAIGALIGALMLLMLIPLLLLFCQCGTFGEFSEMSYDAKEYVIEYNTEGKAADNSVPLLLAPALMEQQNVTVVGNAFNKASILQNGHAFETMVLNKELNRGPMEVDADYRHQHNAVHAQQNLGSVHRNALRTGSFRQKMPGVCFEEMALPYGYLHGYFSERARYLDDSPILGDSVLVFTEEGENSPVGSLDFEGIIEADDDLGFLNDLDENFATLASICYPTLPKLEKVEQIVKSVDSSIRSENSITTSAFQVDVKSEQPPPQQSAVANFTQTFSRSNSINTSPTLLVQPQPLYYLVEHQAPRAVILAEEPVQEMYLVNGLAGAQGLVLPSANILQNTEVEQQGMYLIDGMSTLQGNVMLGHGSNVINTGSLALSSVLVQVEKDRLKLKVPQDVQAGKAKDKTGVKSQHVKKTKLEKLQV